MKKTFTSLLALAGMVVGFTLCSCGGGGGGGDDGNLTGSSFTYNGSGVAYVIDFVERVSGGNAYRAEVYSANEGDLMEVILIGESGNKYTVASASWDTNDVAGLATILTGTGVDKVGTVSFNGGSVVLEFTNVSTDKDQGNCSVTWTVPKGSYYTRENNDAKVYFNPDLTANNNVPLDEDLVVTHIGFRN